jgi:hypothetical protein
MFDMLTFQGVMKGIIFSPPLITIVTVGIAGIIGKITLKLRSDNMSMKCMEVDWIQQTEDSKQWQNFIITVIKNEIPHKQRM